jgi:hypothetical protein
MRAWSTGWWWLRIAEWQALLRLPPASDDTLAGRLRTTDVAYGASEYARSNPKLVNVPLNNCHD